MTVQKIVSRSCAALAVVAATATVSACGSSNDKKASATGTSATSAAPNSTDTIKKNSKNSAVSLTIGSKNFTEQKVLGEIFAQALTAGGYTVKTALNLGDEKIALKALKSGQVSAFPEYTGTALGSDFGVKSDAIPKDPGEAFDQVKKMFAAQGITAEPATPFTSSNEVAVTSATAKKYKLAKISDLSKVAGKLKLYGSPECRQRTDCLLGLKQVYSLKFGSFTPVAIDLRHQVLEKGQADVSIVFTTDPQVKRDDEVLLKDDKGMFPPYNSTLLVKTPTAEKAGADFSRIVALVSKGLTAPVMQELNARVDLDKKTPGAVAKAYLSESGYTK